MLLIRLGIIYPLTIQKIEVSQISINVWLRQIYLKIISCVNH